MLIHVLDDAHVVEQVHRAHLALLTVETLGGGVEVRRSHTERELQPLSKRRRERLAVRRQPLEVELQPTGQLLLGELRSGRGVCVHELRPERVEPLHELLERLRDGEGTEPVDAHVEAPAAALAHMSRGSAADDRQSQPREAGANADPVAAAQEHRRDARPAGAVIDEDPLTAGGAARCHRAVYAEIERVVMDRVEVAEQLANLQARIRDQFVEALHHLRLGQDGKRGQLHPPARQALTPERRVLARVTGERVQSLALEAVDALAGPALNLGELPACSQAATHVLKALDPVAHRFLLVP